MENDKHDRIDGDQIILNGKGKFPKHIRIIEDEKKRDYKLVKTQRKKYQLIK